MNSEDKSYALKQMNDRNLYLNRQLKEKDQILTQRIIMKQEEEINKLKSIIKEVREYITSYINQFNGVYPPVDMRYLDLNKILEILDKGE